MMVNLSWTILLKELGHDSKPQLDKITQELGHDGKPQLDNIT